MIDTTTQGLRLADAPALGEYWEGQGGVYAGIIPDYVGTEPRFLIFAADEGVDLAWGGFGSAEEGVQDARYGHDNTERLVACKRPTHTHDAAKFAAEYEKDGHRDFYLPSSRELQAAAVHIADTFDQTQWYWSSTEKSKILAYGKTFSDDVEMNALFKHMTGRVRPVRTVPVASDAPAA